jgi:hypothetical protein
MDTNHINKRSYIIPGNNQETLCINYNYNPDTGKLIYGASVYQNTDTKIKKNRHNAIRKFELFPIILNTPCWMFEDEIDTEIRTHIYSVRNPETL